MCQIAVKGCGPSGHGSNVSFTLPLRCPLDTAELQGHWVLSGGRAAVGTCPDGDSEDGGWVRSVG